MGVRLCFFSIVVVAVVAHQNEVLSVGVIEASPDPSIRQRRVGALMPLGTPNGWLAFTIKAYGDRPMPQEMIEPHAGDKRYVRRGAKGRFKESEDVGRSLTQDRRRKAKTVAKHGQGDRGDRAS